MKSISIFAISLLALSQAAQPALAQDGVDFGDDTSEWANDDECDDPRFVGRGMATVLLDEDEMHDASDCRTLYQNGEIRLRSESAPIVLGDVDFGDDTSEWANDGECDDPRFEGSGMASFTTAENRMHDASDCSALYSSGDIALKAPVSLESSGLDFGDDTSQWANDDECDDARFVGSGMAAGLTVEHIGRDASDCAAHFATGSVRVSRYYDLAGPIDFGDDEGKYAFDGECDDVRFTGAYSAEMIYITDDIGHDASDCRAAYESGTALWQGNLVHPATGMDASDVQVDESGLAI